MLPAHVSLALSVHFRPTPVILETANREKPRTLPATWAFFHFPEPERISFCISRLHHKSSPPKGPKRPTFSPCHIFIQTRLLALPFTGIQRRSPLLIILVHGVIILRGTLKDMISGEPSPKSIHLVKGGRAK